MSPRATKPAAVTSTEAHDYKTSAAAGWVPQNGSWVGHT